MCPIPSDIPVLSLCVGFVPLPQPSDKSPKYIWEHQGKKRLCWSVGSSRNCSTTRVSAVFSPHTPGPGLHPVPQPRFCRLHSPICSTISGGKTREAKALRKISENSLSRPPMPIFSKFQSGLMIDCRFSLVFDLPAKPKKRFQTQPSRTPAHTDTRTALQVRPQPMTSMLSFKRWPGGHTVTRTQGQDTRDTA